MRGDIDSVGDHKRRKEIPNLAEGFERQPTKAQRRAFLGADDDDVRGVAAAVVVSCSPIRQRCR